VERKEMPGLNRVKTEYPGVYYLIARSRSRPDKSERVYYIRYRRNGKEIEEKAGRQFQDEMTAAKAAEIRAECLEGKRLSRKEMRERDKANRQLKKKFRSMALEKRFASWKIGKDNSECKQAQQVLKEEEFRIFVETASDLMCIIDKDGKFEYVNESMAKTLGYSKEEMIDMPLVHILHKRTLEIKQLIKKGKLDLETAWLTKQGKVVYGEAKAVAVYDKDGKFSKTRVVLRDTTKHKAAIKALRERERELDAKNKSLDEMNSALHVLLEKRYEDKMELEEKVLLNVETLLIPYLEKLTNTVLDRRAKSFVGILESNLRDIISPFSLRLSSKHLKLSPSEIRVANLVEKGKTTKEMANLLNLSSETIASHRRNIRKKIGIRNKKENLRIRLVALNIGQIIPPFNTQSNTID
jgi:PAS domain S-box-containing protein